MIYNQDTANIEASAGVYTHKLDPVSGQHCFTFLDSVPALEYGGKGLLKKAFQAVHNGTAKKEEIKMFMDVFNTVSVDDFKSTYFTVGAGTNIILRDSQEGTIKIPMVARTSVGPDGTPNIGKVSRAAGGSYGCLAASGLREMSEEIICSINPSDKNATILCLDYNESSLSATDKKEILDRAKSRLSSVLERYNVQTDNITLRNIEGQLLDVPGFTEDLLQSVNGEEKIIQSRFITSPVGGDYNIDTILFYDLPKDIRLDSLFIFDGEENFDGDLLKRDWSMEAPETWIKRIQDGMPISQGPKNFFDNYDLVRKALPAL